MRTPATGLLDRKMLAYLDAPFYQNAIQDGPGFIITPQGAATMIPGTIYVANTKGNVKVRLERFIFTADDVYILEVGPLYIRFYRDNGQIGAPTEVVTTYTADEIFDLHMDVQLADTLFIEHGSHHPAKLVRTNDTTWTLSDVDADNGPFMPENTSATTIAPSALTGSVTLTSTTNIFDEDHIGALWRVDHRAPERKITDSFTAETDSSSLFVQKGASWKVVVLGEWDGQIDVEFSKDDVTFWADQPIKSVSNEPTTLDGVAPFDLYVRLSMPTYTSGTAEYFIYAHSYIHKGIARVSAYTSEKIVTATVLKDLHSTDATELWSEGSWSDYRGYPSCSFYYNQRIGYGGTPAEPQVVQVSAFDDIDNFEEGTLSTDAFSNILDGILPSPIRWIKVDDKGLIVGTLSQVVTYYPQDTAGTANTFNPFVKRNSLSYPNGLLAPVEAGSSLIMASLGGKGIAELLFSSDEGTILAPDISQYVKTLLHVDNAVGITDMAFQARPWPILWCTLSDGRLVGLYYDRTASKASWFESGYVGEIDSVEVAPKPTYDQVWLSGKYTIDGSDVRFVGYMDELSMDKPLRDMHFVEMGLKWKGGSADVTGITTATEAVLTLDTWPQDGDGNDMADGDNLKLSTIVGPTALNNKVYTVYASDSGAKTLKLKDKSNSVIIDTSAMPAYVSGGLLEEVENTFGGLTHLANEDVEATLSGVTSKSDTVTAGGQSSFSKYYTSASIGIYQDRHVIPMPFESMKTFGKLKNIKELYLALFRTLKGEVGILDVNREAYEETMREISKMTSLDDNDSSEFTGMKLATVNWTGRRRVEIIIRQTRPLPMTILGYEVN